MKITLTKHENETFTSQTVMLGGHAYFNCTFKSCTLIYTNTATILNNCRLEMCHWRIEYDVLAGNESTLAALKNLLEMLDKGAKGQMKGDLSSHLH